jgi:hypothetical protein
MKTLDIKTQLMNLSENMMNKNDSEGLYDLFIESIKYIPNYTLTDLYLELREKWNLKDSIFNEP